MLFGFLGARGLDMKLLHLNDLTLHKIGQKAEDKSNVCFSARKLLRHDHKCHIVCRESRGEVQSWWLLLPESAEAVHPLGSALAPILALT